MTRLFKSLDDQDYFGYICIGNESLMPCPQLKLEKKICNLTAKQAFMDEISDEHFMTKLTS
jgi:hypothetical protein